ncbi:hypothetical protein EBU94_05440, partial [bacterium]|nr:hypothetical protein [bacterium]
MKPILIVENNMNPLQESVSVSGSKKEYILGGPFTDFGVKNRNDRVYTADKFLPCLNELNERIKTMGVVYGEFDHPDVFDTSLSRASHTIVEAKFSKEQNRVEGKIKLLSTHWGKEARALVDDECPIFVSSRAAGVTEADGTVSLKRLFTYDIVADPGFASAKMNSINESFGYSNNSNFRIYELSKESKFNELLTMNNKNNEFVTKQQLSDYSKYLINEIASTKNQVKKAVKTGSVNPKKLEQLLEYYDELNNTNSKIVKYLDYLADKVQVIVNENKSLKTTADKLISHNDYLAENLEKAINYSEYLAENLDKSISYSNYLAENVDRNISYSEYLAENLDKNIAYSEYIAENLDKNISYSEYLAEHLDNSIAYSEYLAEHVEGNIAYSEYIAEHLDDNIAYSEYLAENLDKSVSYAGMIAEKLNSGRVFEGNGTQFPTLEQAGFDSNEEEENYDSWNNEEMEEVEAHDDMEEVCEPCGDEAEETYEGNSDSDLSKQIDLLINEAKKRKVSETNDLHFLKFLNKSQVDSYYNLTNDEQEQVKLYINERSYFTSSEVLKLIQEALSAKNESLEDKLIRLMPENIKPIWSSLNESAKKSILSQARLYPGLDTESKIEHFWLTRSLKKNESTTKKLVSHDSLIQEDRLSDNDMKLIME